MRDALRREELPVVPAGDVGGGAELRTAPRFTLLIRAAKLITPDGEFLCVIRDASESGISLRIFHPLPDCGEVLIELQNGDRHEAELVWQDEERAGLQFKSAADIARIVETPSQFAKRPIRLNVNAPATIMSLAGQVKATIRNISQQGASIECAKEFAIDQKVKLKAWCLPQTNAKVRWRRDNAIGLIFEDTYQFGELARIIQKMRKD